jgi:phosphoglycolate phosphatase-like HAD superfamily hydrolase
VPLVGMSAERLIPRMAGVAADSDLGRRIAARRHDLFRDVYLDHVTPLPGTRELFQRLRADGVRLGVVSTARRDELDALLEVARVQDVVHLRASAEDVTWPRLDVVAAALEGLGTEPGATLMVGDSPFDIESALQVGVGTIALRSGGWDDRDLDGALAIYDGPRALLAAYDAQEWDWPAAPGRPRQGPGLPANSSLR